VASNAQNACLLCNEWYMKALRGRSSAVSYRDLKLQITNAEALSHKRLEHGRGFEEGPWCPFLKITGPVDAVSYHFWVWFKWIRLNRPED